ncbi:Crp/Fnr family transcriptional regulator [Aquimarina muelleri]|uniref:cAMP-binding protein n=1 Tax=Aquimarina muelleri TaxID=279356 RepID=A0A918N5V2_9FLAO|nr:Crp/Fnr family transcriptional regulator [Aquimarina muelleri]MCX2764768.1 Crp/Fnr family transcriptional regulator [Aquimarina muelleri]GGX33686.1 cAMP-binding protein [Aquimarina muelleri]
MNELHKILEEIIGLTENEWKKFNSKLKKKEFKAKTVIIKEGRIASSLYFIESGLLRTYYNLDGKEINTYFACDKQFMSVFSSFINQTSSPEILEAIEDSKVYELSYQSLIDLYKDSSKFEKFGRILAEKNFLCAQERTLTMQTKTAKKKYLDFIKNYDKKIVLRVPQHQIASFLGIAPESLSRIRKEIFIS